MSTANAPHETDPRLRAMLRDGERIYRLFVEQNGEYAMFLLDTTGVVVTWNLGAQRIKGYRADEIVGQHFSRFYTREDLDARKPELELRLAAHTGRFEDEGWRVRRDGTRFWASVCISSLHDEDGEIVGFAKVTRDLTERRNAEQERLRLAVEAAARDSAESGLRFLRTVVDNLPELAWTALPDGRFDFVNRRWLEYTGMTPDQVQSDGRRRLVAPEMVPIIEERWKHSLATGEPFEMEIPLRGSDGNYRWFLTRVRAARDASGGIVRWIGVNTDVDARRRADEARENARRELEITNRAKDEFLATVSHELRTPLTAILGWAVNVRRRSPPPSIDRALAIIERNARVQRRLIEDVLDMSRIISGKLRLELSSVHVADVVRAAVDTTRAAAEAKRIAIDLDLDDTIMLHADADRLQQIVWNLASNAVKFTPKGGRVVVRVSREGSQVSLAVSDTGPGVPDDLLAVIFEPFRQVDSSTTRSHGGLGLGLAIVRRLVQAHGGTIRATTEDGATGAKFEVKLPVRVAPPVARAAPPAPFDSPGELEPMPRLDQKRVLVVDDEPDARELIALTLEEQGATVQRADSADAALESFASFRPDAVVSDIGMPTADGYELIRRIRALAPEHGGRTPALALTAYASKDDARRAFAAGFQNHLTKPVEPRRLVEVVANLCGVVVAPT